VKDDAAKRESLDRLLIQLRPKLHRYCARMTGSVIDGEDVVQETLLKAISTRISDAVENPTGWLFRIAHNTALDHLRQRARQDARHSHEDPDMIPTPRDPERDLSIAIASLRTFMRLPVAQRSAVILSDVLEYSVEEVSEITQQSSAAVKSTLQRGRLRLSELAQEPEDLPPPALSDAERARLTRYVDCFNSRDYDSVRRMLADDVRLELVNRLRKRGRKEVGEYFSGYASVSHWRFTLGFIDRRPAMLVFDLRDGSPTSPAYFVVLDWVGERVAAIRDFLFARYAIEGAECLVLE
jgi:RNA polymerase sigma-70 factor (ECF subfamily)